MSISEIMITDLVVTYLGNVAGIDVAGDIAIGARDLAPDALW
jgi:hypothetical protein